ncbi:conserved hypothetical protein [Pseudomonas sp. 8BK]|uniref:hypothetical protein n=1 Tax=Pseudomonas sp. 8BK TaxID=2653164 RepID=UPI0012F2ED3D|nr:hypothetical protein [Pseudomonas sp. 8BK]VXC06085.1 conserved hypothetical protein [Pseudomonas sp. 8BK]
METSFSARVWNWYADDEYEKLLSFLQLCYGLEFLALEAKQQSESIPYCPACEVWSEKMLRIKDFADNYGNDIPVDIKNELLSIFESCDNLSSDAFHCDDQFMFSHNEWASIRNAAINCLARIEWCTLQAYAPEFEGRARNVLYGVPYKET